VPVDQTVSSFKEILEGKHDDIPERAFLLKGTIDEVVEAARGTREEEPAEEESGGEENGEEQGGEEQSDAAEGDES
jgi:F-type H+/Na+-transporting ATPase subunit beta